MPALEDLLVPGSIEVPDCRCGAEMHLFGRKPCRETEVRIFKCSSCDHEFQLMVWRAPGIQS
jgi:hypothetical protein